MIDTDATEYDLCITASACMRIYMLLVVVVCSAQASTWWGGCGVGCFGGESATMACIVASITQLPWQEKERKHPVHCWIAQFAHADLMMWMKLHWPCHNQQRHIRRFPFSSWIVLLFVGLSPTLDDVRGWTRKWRRVMRTPHKTSVLNGRYATTNES